MEIELVPRFGILSYHNRFYFVLEQELDLDLSVPKFNCFFPGDRINDDDHARALFQNALEANPQLACLSGMDAGISATGLRVAGVPIGNDEWVQQFVQEKAVDATILEALCRKGTTDAHGEWTAVFRRFVDIKLQLPHFR